MKQTAMTVYEHLMQSPFIIGAMGAITAMLGTTKISFGRRIAMGIAGATSAGFLSPAICVWLGIERPEYLSAMAFGVGMIGLQLTGGIIKIGEDIKKNPNKYLPWKKS